MFVHCNAIANLRYNQWKTKRAGGVYCRNFVGVVLVRTAHKNYVLTFNRLKEYEDLLKSSVYHSDGIYHSHEE